MCITEYNEELHEKTLREEGRQEGLQEGRQELIVQLLKQYSSSQVKTMINVTDSEIEEAMKQIS